MTEGAPSGEAAWGLARDALSALFNFEALLRSPRVPAQTITQVTGDVRAASSALKSAFERSSPTPEDAALNEYAAARATTLLDELSTIKPAMDAKTRLGLERAVLVVARELDSALELRALLDRAGQPSMVELSLLEVVRAAAAQGAGHRPTASVLCHFHGLRAARPIFGDSALGPRLVAACIGKVATAGRVHLAWIADELVVSADPPTEVGLEADGESKIKVVAAIPPTDLVIVRAARAFGGAAKIENGAVRLAFE